jgi:signal transduction histidine kinase
MTPELITAAGWSAAALFAALHVRTRRRLVLIARATHELRGPLSAARLGLGTIRAEPGRVAAIDLELARAGRALEDLTAAPSGARRPEHVERVDLITLTRAYAPAWSTLAAAHGAGFRLELVEPRPRHLHAVPSPDDDPPPSTHRDDAPPTLGGDDEGSRRPGRRADAPRRAGRDARPAGGDGSTSHGGPPLATAAGDGSRPPGSPPGDRPPIAAAGDGPRSPGGGRDPRAVSARDRRRRARVTAVAGTPSPWPDPIPPSHRWSWRPPEAAVVLADPFRVAQAVANLVANAAEHGGGLVRLRVTRAGERVWIEVADDGPGLPAPVPALVACARARRGRRGHGLAIAGAIAEQLGGRLTAMPAPSGARLVLDLPAAR